MTLRTEKVTVSLALAVLLHPTFQWVAATTSAQASGPPAWLVTPLDRALPVVPGAVWLYLSWYPASALVLLAPRMSFRRLSLAYGVAFAICIVAYLTCPITIARPVVVGDGPSSAMLRLVYDADRPTNLFPSFHAAVAAILMTLRPRSVVIRGGLLLWMIGICGACVLTKQHYVLDVVAGLAVGAVATKLADAAWGWTMDPRSGAVEAAVGGGDVT
jgi:membrane-associated phospholipid phosphatase